MPGSRPGRPKPVNSGRRAGVPNKSTARQVEAMLEAERELAHKLSEAQAKLMRPLDTLLLIMRTALKAGHTQLAMAAAEKAAPFCHARLANVALEATVTRSIRDFSDAELMTLISEARLRGEIDPDDKAN